MWRAEEQLVLVRQVALLEFIHHPSGMRAPPTSRHCLTTGTMDEIAMLYGRIRVVCIRPFTRISSLQRDFPRLEPAQHDDVEAIGIRPRIHYPVLHPLALHVHSRCSDTLVDSSLSHARSISVSPGSKRPPGWLGRCHPKCRPWSSNRGFDVRARWRWARRWLLSMPQWQFGISRGSARRHPLPRRRR